MREKNIVRINDVVTVVRKFMQRRKIRIVGFIIYSTILLATGAIGGCKIGRRSWKTAANSTGCATNGPELQPVPDMDEFRDIISGERERNAESFEQTKASVDSMLNDLLQYFSRDDSLSSCKEELNADKHVQD